MNIHKYLAQKKEFYELFLSFINSDGDFSEKYSNLIDFMDKNNYFNNQDEMNSILLFILVDKNV